MKTLSALTLGMALCLSGCSQQTTEEKVAQARAQVENGDYKTAAVTLKNVVADNPQLAQARALLGKSYLVLGDPALAEKELSNALSNGVSPEQVLPSLLQAYKQQGKFIEIEELSAYADTVDESLRAEMLAYRVYALVASDDKAAAQALYETSSAQLAGLPYTKLAEAYLRLADGRNEKVIEITDAILTQSPDMPEAHFIQGSVYLGQGEFNAASEAFTKYLEVFPENATAKLSLASALIRDGQAERAEKISDELLKRYPNQPVANQVKALASYEAGDYETASKHIELAISNGYDQPSNRILAGASKFRLQNYEQAYSHFQRAAAELPQSHNAHRLLALTQTVLGYSGDVSATYQNIDEITEADFTLLASNVFELSRGGRRDDASSLLQRLDESGLSSANAMTKKGILKLSLDNEEGMADLRQALEENPDQSNARKALVLAYLVADDERQTLEQLEIYLDREENSPQARLFAASIFAQMGDAEQAETIYQQLIEDDSENLAALVGLSELAKRNEEPEKAFSYLEQALKQRPDFTPALLKIQLLNEALPEASQARISELMKAAIKANPNDTSILVSYAARLIQEKRAGDAVDLLSDVERTAALPGAFWSVYADALSLDGRLRDAIELLQEWIEASPNNSNAYYRLISAYDLVRNFSGARDIAQRAMQRVEPKDAYKLLYSYYELRLNNVEIANRALESISEPYSTSPMAKGIKGIYQVSKGQLESAIPRLRVFHGSYNNSLSTEVLSYALKQTGRVDEARQILETYLGRKPGDEKIRSLLASLLSNSDPDIAKSHYQRLIDENPKNIFALNNLAGMYIDEGNFDRAIELAEKALDQRPESAAIQDTLGLALLRQGDLEKALYFLEQAYNTSDYDADVYMNYAEALQRSGKSERAKQVLMQVNDADKQGNTRYSELFADITG